MAARKIARREWTKSDIRELKSLAKKVPARQVARKLRRSEGAVRQKRSCWERHSERNGVAVRASDSGVRFSNQGGKGQMISVACRVAEPSSWIRYEIESHMPGDPLTPLSVAAVFLQVAPKVGPQGNRDHGHHSVDSAAFASEPLGLLLLPL